MAEHPPPHDGEKEIAAALAPFAVMAPQPEAMTPTLLVFVDLAAAE